MRTMMRPPRMPTAPSFLALASVAVIILSSSSSTTTTTSTIPKPGTLKATRAASTPTSDPQDKLSFQLSAGPSQRTVGA